ncbi:MAG: lipopolysaccharide heptosyltransferase 1, partial [Betaproteobacteria bacterium HGW-Betaproteobacteria-2]
MPRLLIVKTTSLGDVIHNLPVINDIRAHHPDMAIDWVVE